LRTPARLRARVSLMSSCSAFELPRIEAARAGLEPASDDWGPGPVDPAIGGEC
jgi:hypothetical protein